MKRKTVPFSITVSEHVADWIERKRKEENLSRSKFIDKLLDRARTHPSGRPDDMRGDFSSKKRGFLEAIRETGSWHLASEKVGWGPETLAKVKEDEAFFREAEFKRLCFFYARENDLATGKCGKGEAFGVTVALNGNLPNYGKDKLKFLASVLEPIMKDIKKIMYQEFNQTSADSALEKMSHAIDKRLARYE